MKKFTYFVVSLTMIAILCVIGVNFYNEHKGSTIDINIKKGLDNIAQKQIELDKLESVNDIIVDEKDFQFLWLDKNSKGAWTLGFFYANKVVEFGVWENGKFDGVVASADFVDGKVSNGKIAISSEKVSEMLKPLLSFKINNNEQVNQLKAIVSDVEALIYFIVKKLAESEITSVIDISDCYMAIDAEGKMFKVEHIFVNVKGSL